MKRIYTLAIAIIATASCVFAQAPIPVPNYTFDAPFPTMPSGWSNQLLIGAGTATTYATGNTAVVAGPACRLDATGEYVQIWLAGQAGNVKYYIKGSTANSVPFSGTFTVEQSPDGISWTTLHQFVNTALSTSSFGQFTDIPLANTRYIRWFFTTKVSGSNVALDDIQIDAPVLQVPEINASQGTTPILNNGYAITSAPLGDSSLVTINIQNAGSGGGYLQCGVPAISGANASEFTVVSHPDSIAPNSNQNLIIKFVPTALGTRNAMVTFSNSDSDENPFVINLYATGGNFATAPAGQPSNLTFTNVKTYRLTGKFSSTPVDLFGGYLVVRSNVALPANLHPTNGKVYMRGDTVGTYKVAASSMDTTFVSAEIYANTNYHFTVWAYNGQGTQRSYNFVNALTASATTPATMVAANEYNGITPTASTFITDLHNLINPHTSLFYSNYAGTMINKFTARDTTLGRKVMTSVYSNKQVVYTPPFDYTATDFSREHTYAHSWMPSFPADGSGAAPNNVERPEYNDQHHLFPALLTNENILRSNNPFGEVVNATVTNGQCKLGTNLSGATVFEPANRQKGDAARALFYMAVCYTGVDGYTFDLPPNSIINENQTLDVLLKWHYQDPPDSYEIARNDFLDSLQGNRNPFVDNPEYACYINFLNMTHIASPTIPCDTFAVCSAPVSQLADSITNTSVKISWNNVVGANSYTVKYKLASAATYTDITNAVSPLTISGLLGNSSYNYQVVASCNIGNSVSNALNFTTTNVGINELSMESVSVTPNPNNGNFRISINNKISGSVNISVIDIAGRTCYSDTKTISNSSMDVNTSGLKAGVYTLRLITKNGTVNKKVVIE